MTQAAQVRAALDETGITVEGAMAYVVVATIVLEDEGAAKLALDSVIDHPGRTRPFHWAAEGAGTKQQMVDCLIELGVVSHVVVHHPTGRRKQEAARKRALHKMLPALIADGVGELVIESRDDTGNGRDKGTILDVLQSVGKPGVLTYCWLPNTERLLWLPDVVCGAVRGFLAGDDTYYSPLRHAQVIGEITYIDEAHD